MCFWLDSMRVNAVDSIESEMKKIWFNKMSEVVEFITEFGFSFNFGLILADHAS